MTEWKYDLGAETEISLDQDWSFNFLERLMHGQERLQTD